MSYAASGVSVRVGPATLLDEVSLEVGAGEIIAVAGPNGAGKTTLIRVLAGDTRPSSGSVALDERPLSEWPAAELARRRAVMAADSAVAFGFSAREVALMGRLPSHGGDPGPDDQQVVDGLLEAVGCIDLAERTFATLSTGERQRVQLARAIGQLADRPNPEEPLRPEEPEGVPDDRFLLLDEPTSSLDPAHQHTAMRLLRRQAEAGRGVLAVLHDLNLAAAYADRIALMKDGRIIEIGTPAEVLRADLLQTVFEVPMLVVPHPHLPHLLVVAEPRSD